jgi:hypothetical protein
MAPASEEEANPSQQKAFDVSGRLQNRGGHNRLERGEQNTVSELEKGLWANPQPVPPCYSVWRGGTANAIPPAVPLTLTSSGLT